MNMVPLDIKTMKLRLLVHEAKSWIAFTERGGDNKGQVVEAFQMVVDGTAEGEPWCMAFVQYCMKQVDSAMEEMFRRKLPTSGLEKSEHCLTTWHKSPIPNKFRSPLAGRVVIWRHGISTSGHTGIVVQVEKNTGYIWTVEGNTGDSNSSVQREGDGIYLKRRSTKGTGNMKIVGYLQPWV